MMVFTTMLYQLFAMAVFSSVSVCAQITTLKGLVIGSNGAVIAGATVAVRSGNNLEFATRTDVQGVFLASVRSEQVSIEISAPCFLRWEQSDFQIPDLQILDLGQIDLKADAACERPECPLAGVDPVETQESSVSTEIQNRPLIATSEKRPDKPGRVSGLVTALDGQSSKSRKTERPVANAFVRFRSSFGVFKTRTDSRGRYHLELPPGKYSIYFAENEVCVICVAYYAKDFEIRPRKTFELNMVLRLVGEGTILLPTI